MNQMTRREFNQTGTTGIEAKCPLEITVDGEVRLIVTLPASEKAADEFDSLPLDKKASGTRRSRQ